jgi:hypothetical protein
MTREKVSNLAAYPYASISNRWKNGKEAIGDIVPPDMDL